MIGILAALAIATNVWGPAPCDIHYTITPLQGDALAQTAGCENGVAVIEIDPFTAKFRPGPMCSIAWHEIGHVYGLEHVDNWRDVMFPMYVRVQPRCKKRLTRMKLIHYDQRETQ